MNRLKADPRELVKSISEKQARMLALELILRWTHPQSCSCILVSGTFDDPERGKVVIVGPALDASGDPVDCDCGAELALSKIIEGVLEAHR